MNLSGQFVGSKKDNVECNSIGRFKTGVPVAQTIFLAFIDTMALVLFAFGDFRK